MFKILSPPPLKNSHSFASGSRPILPTTPPPDSVSSPQNEMASLPSGLPTRAGNHFNKGRAHKPLPRPTAQGDAPFAVDSTEASHAPQGRPSPPPVPRVFSDPSPAAPHLRWRSAELTDATPARVEPETRILSHPLPHSHFRCRANLRISRRRTLRASAETAFPRGLCSSARLRSLTGL